MSVDNHSGRRFPAHARKWRVDDPETQDPGTAASRRRARHRLDRAAGGHGARPAGDAGKSNPSAGTRAAGAGECLDVFNDQTTAGTKAEIWHCNGRANQQWQLNVNDTITGVQSDCAST